MPSAEDRMHGKICGCHRSAGVAQLDWLAAGKRLAPFKEHGFFRIDLRVGLRVPVFGALQAEVCVRSNCVAEKVQQRYARDDWMPSMCIPRGMHGAGKHAALCQTNDENPQYGAVMHAQ